MIVASAVVAFLAGFAVARLFLPGTVTHTVTETTTAPPTARAGVPAACLEGIALTRRIERAADRREVEQLRNEFDGAAAQCRIPAGCTSALAYAPQIVAEQSRAKLRALVRQFEDAAATCR